mgnify:CR=1 FL=1
MRILNKGLTGVAKITLIFIILIVSLFFTYSFTPTFAKTPETIWTTDIYGNLKTDFVPEETVYIHGSNFLTNNDVDISITRPDTIINTGSTLTDDSGSFVYNYQLDGINGTYYVTATDGTNTA